MTLITRALLLVVACGLAACSSSPRPETANKATIQRINNAQQYSDVIAALEASDVQRARKLLKKMAQRDAADQRVITLRDGIDGNPQTLLGALAFSYRVQPGDTLSSLAQRFLGDRDKFFLLARYNSLARSRVATGQVILIPGVEPVVKVDVVRQKSEANPADALPRPSVNAPRPTVVITDSGLAKALRGQALKALNQGKVAVAIRALRRARTADPTNEVVRRELARAERLSATLGARQ